MSFMKILQDMVRRKLVDTWHEYGWQSISVDHAWSLWKFIKEQKIMGNIGYSANKL